MLSNIDAWKLAAHRNPNPVFFVDTSFSFTYCNPAWCRLTGYTISEFNTMEWKDISEVCELGVDEAVIRNAAVGSDNYLEKTVVRKDGEKVRTQMTLHRYPPSGVQAGLIVFGTPAQSVGVKSLQDRFQVMEERVAGIDDAVQKVIESSHRVDETLRSINDNSQADRQALHALIQRGDGVHIGGDMNRESFNRQEDSSSHRTHIGGTNAIQLFLIAFITFGILLFTSSVAAYLFYSSMGNKQVGPTKKDISPEHKIISEDLNE